MESVDAIAQKIVREALPCSCESCKRDRDVLEPAVAAALAAERANTADWKERAQRAEAEAMTLRDFERARNTVNRQTKAESEL